MDFLDDGDVNIADIVDQAVVDKPVVVMHMEKKIDVVIVGCLVGYKGDHKVDVVVDRNEAVEEVELAVEVDIALVDVVGVVPETDCIGYMTAVEMVQA